MERKKGTVVGVISGKTFKSNPSFADQSAMQITESFDKSEFTVTAVGISDLDPNNIKEALKGCSIVLVDKDLTYESVDDGILLMRELLMENSRLMIVLISDQYVSEDERARAISSGARFVVAGEIPIYALKRVIKRCVEARELQRELDGGAYNTSLTQGIL